ncbi:putative stress-responsive transcriptional regulator [Beggiatoa alba B18LD]|uniref:Putative stress-responsive transcriptional regulator n=1 Tax=Beggiatoa alba B18LD TaxID=395493 RepID=I3CJI0_9GAMM|nr:PspC domain-containing protein [Beggiatoa alba]EIJ43773.1 putative stress-responsive transcriptional regulator [Beggiatoa alba B18LD]
MSYKRLYKNKENKWLLGVCAGIADYWDIDVVFIRLTVFFTLFFFFPVIFFGYLLLGIFLPVKPVTVINEEQQQFVTQLPILLTELDIKFTDIEQRMRKVENYVTSDTFELQRKIWRLQDKS